MNFSNRYILNYRPKTLYTRKIRTHLHISQYINLEVDSKSTIFKMVKIANKNGLNFYKNSSGI